MGFAPIKWTCTAFFRPRQLTDRAILANRQTQEKKKADVLESGTLCQLHDIRQLPGIITDDRLQIVSIDKIGLHIVDDVEEVFDGGIACVEPEVHRHF